MVRAHRFDESFARLAPSNDLVFPSVGIVRSQVLLHFAAEARGWPTRAEEHRGEVVEEQRQKKEDAKGRDEMA
jgi:hypothetical protein